MNKKENNYDPTDGLISSYRSKQAKESEEKRKAQKEKLKDRAIFIITLIVTSIGVAFGIYSSFFK